jgi:hypothetical protein
VKFAAKLVGVALVMIGLVYGGLVACLEWQRRVEDRAIAAQSFSQPDSIQVIAAGWDNRTLIFFLPAGDQTQCDVFIDQVKTDKQLTESLRAVGFNQIACMQAKAKIK